MHPAYSVIVFTTASGAGYGLLFWASLAHAAGLATGNDWLELTALTLALVLVTTGLLASTLHLGRPERAIRAFSQWRTSWLSREGVLALATYAPAGLLWLAVVFGVDSGLTRLLAVLAVLGAVATVYATGMIYASLRTIRQWHNPLVAPVYLAFSAATGALLAALLAACLDGPLRLAAGAAIAALVVAAALKIAYWRAIDAGTGRYTAEMATGLGHIGRVRPLDPPHTRPNFVMREMGYQVARKHARRLRVMSALALFAVSPLLVLLAAVAGGWGAVVLAALAAVSATLGVLVERWLFFAEADHVAMVYYRGGCG